MGFWQLQGLYVAADRSTLGNEDGVLTIRAGWTSVYKRTTQNCGAGE